MMTQVDAGGRVLERGGRAHPAGPSHAPSGVRVSGVTVVTASLANRHIRGQGLVKACDAATFVNDAESAFSERFRSVVGDFLHDGPPVDYEPWRSDLVDELRIIDVEEGAPVPS